MEVSGSGAKDREQKGRVDMVANSEHSAPKDKRSTKKINALTQDQALEILQQAIINCQQSGLVIDLRDGNEGETLLAMKGVVLANGWFVLANGGNHE
jgi:hypothetical protein